VQYEKFYAGANFVTRGHAFRTFDWDTSSGMVDAMLARSPPPASDG
jgi:4-hydroxyphenylacetate 3-monooxygenase